MLYPLPAVMASCGDQEGRTNIITVAWTGTVCTNPAMVYISVRPQRYSYDIIRDSGEFVINLTTEKLQVKAHLPEPANAGKGKEHKDKGGHRVVLPAGQRGPVCDQYIFYVSNGSSHKNPLL